MLNLNSPNLNAMAVFAKVVETGGFTSAAAELRISKSAVSKQVALLEDKLQARLLNRTTRRLSVTEVGREFYIHCERMVAEAEQAEQVVQQLQDQPRGTLRVNLPMSFGLDHVFPALPDFMARYPDLKIDADLDDRVIDMVAEGYDLAIRIAKLPDSTLIAKKLAPFRLAVCATPEYWQQHGRPEHPKDLTRHNCLLYKYLIHGNEWRFNGAKGPFGIRINGTMKANSGSALTYIALGGLGVYMAPTFMVGEHLKSGRLEAVLNDWVDPELAIYAVYPQTRHLTAKVRVFIDFLSELYGDTPYWDV